ncbi:hypothetical protein QJU96_10465, partial [Pasteurella skyensis]|nr:hypothetical protein [Pasteurella skyensis]
IEKALDLTYKANGLNTQTTKLNEGLNFVNGDGTTASVEADGKVKIGLSQATKDEIEAGKDQSIEKVVGGTGVTVTSSAGDDKTYTVAIDPNLLIGTGVDRKTYFHVNSTGQAQAGNSANLDLADGVGGAKGIGAIAIGQNAVAEGNYATVIGGNGTNEATGEYSSIIGGKENKALDKASFIGSGKKNRISKNDTNAAWDVNGVYQYDDNGVLITKEENGKQVPDTIDNIGYNDIGGSSSIVGGYGNVIRSKVGSFIGGGVGNAATGEFSSVLGGFNNIASGNHSVAMGQAVKASGDSSTAMGHGTTASGNASTAMGSGSTASGTGAMSMGVFTEAKAEGSTALGWYSKAEGKVSTSLGNYTKAIGENATAIGNHTKASGGDSTAMGWGTKAEGHASTAMGNNTTASGYISTAMGKNTVASGQYSLATGIDTKATGDNAFASGEQSTSSGYTATAMGYGTTASGTVSTAMGQSSSASGYASTAMGVGTSAKGLVSNAAGVGTQALGTTSTSIGANSVAAGESAFASGGDYTAIAKITDDLENNQTAAYSGILSAAEIAALTSGTPEEKAQAIEIAAIKVARAKKLLGGQAYTKGSMALGTGTIAGSATLNPDGSVKLNDNGTPADKTDDFYEVGTEEAIAIGYRSQATADKTMVLGFDANATVTDGVALGSNAKADTQAGRFGYDLATNSVSKDTSAVWKSTLGALAIGDAATGKTRQITGVAAGTDDDDAVNVAQLKKATATAAGGNKQNYVHVNDGTNDGTGDEATNLGAVDSAGGAATKDSIAIGRLAIAGADPHPIDPTKPDMTPVKQGAIALGSGAKATGENAIAIGSFYGGAIVRPEATGDQAIAIGGSNNASANFSTAIGTVNTATKKWTTVIGHNSNATGEGATAIGRNSDATALEATALGGATASGNYAFAAGQDVTASGQSATAHGFSSWAEGDYSTALGFEARAKGSASMAVGHRSQAMGRGSLASGGYLKPNTTGGIVEVVGGKALTDGAIALGGETIAGTQDGTQEAIAVGYRSQATADKTMALGFDANATVTDGVALGSNARADTQAGRFGYDLATNTVSQNTSAVWKSTLGALAIGDVTAGKTRQITGVAAGTDDDDAVNVAQLKKATSVATAAGNKQNYFHTNTTDSNQKGNATNLDDVDGIGGAKGAHSLASGENAQALQENSIAIGRGATTVSVADNTSTSGVYESKMASIALGNQAKAQGAGSIAIGDKVVAKGQGAVVIGGRGTNEAIGANSVAMGVGTTASGDLSTAMGRNTIASGNYATAMGVGTTASGYLSTAMGRNTIASGNYATAMGVSTKAVGRRGFAVGRNTVAGSVDPHRRNSNAAAFGYKSQALANGSFATGGIEFFLDDEGMGGKPGGIARSSGAIAMGTETIAGRKIEGEQNILQKMVDIVEKRYNVDITTPVTLANKNAIYNEILAKTDIENDSRYSDVGFWGLDTFLKEEAMGGTESVAVGYRAESLEDKALALGFDAKATHEKSVALGSEAETREEVDVNSATLNGITYGNFAGTPDGVVSIGKAGNEKQLINVAAGEISATSTDAINGSQLYATNAAVGNVANSVKTNFGGNANLQNDGTISFTNIGGTGETTIHDAIRSVKAEASDKSIETVVGTNGVEVTSTAGDDKTYTVGLDTATKGKVDSALQTIKTEINGQTVVQTLDKDNNIAKFNQGKNIVLTNNNGSIQVATADEVVFDKVTVGNVIIDQNDGINAGSKVISNVATGVKGTDAVNVDQLTETVTKSKVEVADGTNVASVVKTQGTDGHDIYTVNAEGTKVAAGSSDVVISSTTDAATNDTTYAVDLSQDIKDDIADKSVEKVAGTTGITVTSTAGDDKTYTVALDQATQDQIAKEESVVAGNTNLNVTQTGTNATGGKEFIVTLADALTGITSIGNTPNGAKITLNDTDKNVSVNGGKITDVAKGTVATDAVNLGQLEEYVTNSAKPTEVTVSEGVVAPVGTYSDATDKNLQIKKGTSANGAPSYDIKLADKVTLGEAGNQVVLDGTAGNVTAGKVAINGTAGTIGGLTNKTFDPTNFVSGQAATEDQLKVVSDAAADKSIETVVGTNGVEVTSTAGDDKTYTVGLDTATKGKVDSALQTIKTEINGQTVVQTLDKDNNIAKFNQGKNIVLTNNNGSIQVATADEVVFDKVTVGNVIIDQNDGINAGSKVISNVATGVKGTDAVNVDQLTETVTKSKVEVADGTNVASVVKTQGTDGHDIYTVNAEGTKVAAGSSDVVISSTTDAATNDTTYAVDLSQDIKDDIADKSVEKVAGTTGITVTSTAGDDKTYTVALDQATQDQIAKEESVVAGNTNLNVTQTGTNATGGKEFIVTLADALTGITSIGNTLNGAKITLNDTDKNVSVNGGKLTNVAKGTEDTDAVNVSQLNEVKATVGETSVEVVKAVTGQDFLTVSETTTPASATNKEYTVGIDVSKLTSNIVNNVNNTTIIEKALDLTYKANGLNTQTTKLNEGLNFVDGDGTTASVEADGKVKIGLSQATKDEIEAGKDQSIETVVAGEG